MRVGLEEFPVPRSWCGWITSGQDYDRNITETGNELQKVVKSTILVAFALANGVVSRKR
jgi:hypothetical protein